MTIVEVGIIVGAVASVTTILMLVFGVVYGNGKFRATVGYFGDELTRLREQFNDHEKQCSERWEKHLGGTHQQEKA